MIGKAGNLTPTLTLVMLLGLMMPALAQSGDADRAANVTKAAKEIGLIHGSKGANGASAAVEACYARVLPRAKALTQELEACMTQDMLVSQMAAAVSRQLSPEARKNGGLSEPDVYQKVVTKRWMDLFTKFGVSVDEGKKFSQLVNTQGFQVFSIAMRSNPR
jgi:hypothetical protein